MDDKWWFKRKKGGKNHSKISDLSNWKDRAPIFLRRGSYYEDQIDGGRFRLQFWTC
jgi:hypothetical protein